MDRQKKKKIAAATAALLYLQGEAAVSPSRWAASGREQIMRDRARVTARHSR